MNAEQQERLRSAWQKAHAMREKVYACRDMRVLEGDINGMIDSYRRLDSTIMCLPITLNDVKELQQHMRLDWREVEPILVEMGLFPAQRSEAMAENNKPVDKVRIGNVSATIWEQDNGFYNATLERNYKDKNGKWQSTNSFNVDDLIVVAKVADKAADRMIALREEQQQEYEEEQRLAQGR